tara:strand:+ start:6603 stop:6878 length:276 start_codon:yes stop_codon:yes gene_type:complete
MNGRIDLGFPEILLVCGTWSIVSGNFALGITMGALGLLGALFRSALRIHKLQQEEQSRQQLLKEVNNAGSELGQVVMSLFKGTGGGDSNVH